MSDLYAFSSCECQTPMIVFQYKQTTKGKKMTKIVTEGYLVSRVMGRGNVRFATMEDAQVFADAQEYATEIMPFCHTEFVR